MAMSDLTITLVALMGGWDELAAFMRETTAAFRKWSRATRRPSRGMRRHIRRVKAAKGGAE